MVSGVVVVVETRTNAVRRTTPDATRSLSLAPVTSPHLVRALRITVLALGAAAASAQAPCPLAFAPGEPLAGASAGVGAFVPWDPDGPGPAPQQLIVVGEFATIGSVAGGAIAAYEPTTRQWTTVAPGLTRVTAVAVRANGNLLACAQLGVFEWNGSTWTQLGGNMLSAVTVAELPSGDVVAGGNFTNIGGVAIHGVARWNGSSWQAMGAPTVPWSLGNVERLQRLPNGDLLATGLFTQIGGVACSLIARFDGSAWWPLGAGSATSPVSSTITTGGDVVASGSFTTATGQAPIARWDGSAWHDVSVGLPFTFGVFAPLPGDEVLAVGPTGGLFASNQGVWSPFAPWGSGLAAINCMHAFSATDVLVGGSFTPNAVVPGARLARWNGSSWQLACTGNLGEVRTASVLPDGSWFVGGLMTAVGGQIANRLARFDGTTWTPIASSAINAVKYSVARPNGEVVLVGEFPNAQGGMDFVMSWSGGQVTPILQGLWGARIVQTMALAANGDVLMAYLDFATITSGIARYDGSTVTFTPWSAIGPYAMLGLPNGDVLVATFQVGSPNTVWRWNGSTLSPFGAPLNATPLTLGRTRNGDIVAGGAFTSPSRIARWDGTAWQPYGAGFADPVTSLVVLPDDSIVAADYRSTSQGNSARVQRWNGTSWSLLGQCNTRVDLAWSPAGEVAVYGAFLEIGGAVSAGFARLQTPCAAAVLDRGGGCLGSAGPLALTAVERAWLGGALRTRVTGLPVGALSIGVFGSAPQVVSLAQLHPLGAQGCDLLATDDILLQASVVGGAATPAIAVPTTAALVGASFEHQVLGVEVDANGHAAAITSSNALHCTIGAF